MSEFFSQGLEKTDVAYQFIDCSEGEERRSGRWASGPTYDGRNKVAVAATAP